VHGLRKDGPGNRGFRPGVLTGALLAGLLVALAACSQTSGGTAAGAVGLKITWFQLQSGIFAPVADPHAAVSVANRPWTVQARVADMAFLDDTLYCAVNGSGLASMGKDAAGAPVFSYHPDSLIFAHRTVTTLVPRQGALAIHLYYNALLNDASLQDLAISGISLVSYLPAQSDYAFLISPFQRKNPDWEAVGFAPESENSFDFEWKYTDASETRFAYTRYHADTRAEEAVDRETYLAALGVPSITGPDVPTTLAAFFASCRAGISLPSSDTALQFSLRSRESPVRRNYRSQKESDSAVAVPVFQEQGSLFALLPAGKVLSAVSGGSRTIALPRLPQGFRYTDLVKWGDALVLPWEETSFTDVGRAGILVFPLPR